MNWFYYDWIIWKEIRYKRKGKSEIKIPFGPIVCIGNLQIEFQSDPKTDSGVKLKLITKAGMAHYTNMLLAPAENFACLSMPYCAPMATKSIVSYFRQLSENQFQTLWSG